MATIQDVAQLAKVSVSSVSNVLNGKTDRLRPETFARVQEAIRMLGYRPKLAARHLKTGRIPMIGLLVPSTANPSFGQLAASMESYAQARYGYRMLFCNTHRDREQEARMFDDLIAFGVGAAIVVSSLGDERHLESARERGLTVVSYDRGPPPGATSKVDHIFQDNVEAGRLAADHLIRHGHDRIAFAMPAGMTMSRIDKIAGFRRAAQAAARPIEVRVIESPVASRFGDEELANVGFEIGLSLGREAASRPTGVVTVNDMLAIGLMAGLRSAGLQVPQDVSVIGMDNLPMAAFMHPALSSVAMPRDDMARALVDRAVLSIEQPETPAQDMQFAPWLEARQSVRDLSASSGAARTA